jgi:hypothetical protein
MKKLLLLAGLVLLLPRPAHSQAAADSVAIRQTALDYIEGWWTGNADRMSRAVHPNLAKRFVFKEDNGESGLGHTTADGLVQSTRMGRGTDLPAEERRARVEILDIYRDIATVKLSSTRLIDYLHLVRWNGEWKIVNVLWAPGPESK